MAPRHDRPDLAWRVFVLETVQCLRFYTRLPTPRLAWEMDPHGAPDFSRIPRMLPVAGAILGGVGAAALVAASWIGLPPMAVAAVTLTAQTLATGALHEDALADMADGFWGGHTPERRLEIMADSRIGSYGATALALGLLLRFSAIAGLVAQAGPGRAALALVATAAIARVAGLFPLWALSPARPGGKSASVGRPTDRTMATACSITLALAVLLLAPGFGVVKAALALALGGLTAWLCVRLARAKIGGHTGDVAGAVTLIAEIAALLGLLTRI
ncbi:adenosylcobinamide-GDP ribazoletransferase [Alsobacter sp. KACC 23698]|uniref:Adenosylcobinamide-GDP ribazoletransferase n=1 Tax=Alsobacter sp. KACC 23698 TaxID=3149229 RepID=A0AAU7JII4_9HYPH